MSAPTISGQRVTNSVDANPCLANASVKVLCRRSERGRGCDLPGLFMERGSATWVPHDGSSAHGAGEETSRPQTRAGRDGPFKSQSQFADRRSIAPSLV